MAYCYSETECLWYGSWNRHVCRKGKCAADRLSRSTWVNPSRKQRCCSPSCLWSQAQRDTSDLDNSQNLGYWLTISNRCICMQRLYELRFVWVQKYVAIPESSICPILMFLSDFSIDLRNLSFLWEHQNFPVKIYWNCNSMGLRHHHFGFRLFWHFLPLLFNF